MMIMNVISIDTDCTIYDHKLITYTQFFDQTGLERLIYFILFISLLIGQIQVPGKLYSTASHTLFHPELPLTFLMDLGTEHFNRSRHSQVTS